MKIKIIAFFLIVFCGIYFLFNFQHYKEQQEIAQSNFTKIIAFMHEKGYSMENEITLENKTLFLKQIGFCKKNLDDIEINTVIYGILKMPKGYFHMKEITSKDEKTSKHLFQIITACGDDLYKTKELYEIVQKGNSVFIISLSTYQDIQHFNKAREVFLSYFKN